MGAPMEPTKLDEEIVDAINAVYGRHDRTRALHAKGVFCEATFTATPEAAEKSNHACR